MSAPVWDLKFTVEFGGVGLGDGVSYCACAYDEESGELICGWSAGSMAQLFALIEASAASWSPL